MIRANIDGITEGVLHGWLWDMDTPDASCVFIGIDGIVVGEVRANLFREDLAVAEIGTANHAFQFNLPVKYYDGLNHTFTLQTKVGDLAVVHCSTELTTARNPELISGRVERVADGVAYGWAVDNLHPGDRVTVIAVANGVVVGSAVANRPREDLLDFGFGDGQHGFQLALNNAVLSVDGTGKLDFLVQNGALQKVLASIALPGRPKRTVDLDAHVSELVGTEDDGTEVTLDDLMLSVVPEDALRKLCKTSSAVIFLHAKSPKNAIESSFASSDVGFEIVTPILQGWFRILRLLPIADTLCRHDWTFSVRFSSKHEQGFVASLVEYSESGVFRVVFSVARHRRVAVGFNEHHLSAKSNRLKAADFDGLPRSVFLALEFNEALSASAFEIDIQPSMPEASVIPYRNSQHPLAVALADLNDRFSAIGSNLSEGWKIEMVDLAVKLECFETAGLLLERIDFTQLLDAALQVQYLQLFAEVAFATGLIAELQIKLLKHYQVVVKDDRLFSALSLCFPSGYDLAGQFAQLPSGRANRSYISRDRLSSASLNALLAPSRPYDDGQTDLLLASQLRDSNQAAYLEFINSFLSRDDLAPINSIDLSARNVLSTIRFAPTPECGTDNGTVSVIMSAFNAADTIGYAIQSLLNQTYKNIEILICDDRSRDDTTAMLKIYNYHPSVRVFQSVANQGPYNIRNSLIAQATGQFITFHDADDLAHPERIARQVEALYVRGKEACIGRWLRFRPDGQIVFFRDQRCLRLSVVSMLLSRTAFEKTGGYRSVLCGADSEVYEGLRMRGGHTYFAELNMPLIFGLWSSQSLTQQAGLEATEDGYRSLARRSYAEMSARHRLFGSNIVASADVDNVNRTHGIYRQAQGTMAL